MGTSAKSSPAALTFIFSLNLMAREAMAMSVVWSSRAEIPTPVPPPVTVTRADGFKIIKRSAVCCAMGSTVSLPLMRCACMPVVAVSARSRSNSLVFIKHMMQIG